MKKTKTQKFNQCFSYVRRKEKWENGVCREKMLSHRNKI